MFEVMSRQCEQCLFSRDRIVPGSRAAGIIADCKRRDVSFECHKGTMAGREIACRAHFDTGVGQLARIAGRLRAVRFIDPDSLEDAA